MTTMMHTNKLLEELLGKHRWLIGQPAWKQAPQKVLLRLFFWRMRCWLKVEATVRLQPWDIKLCLPPQWRGVAKLIYAFRDLYELELRFLENLLSPGAVFTDVGAAFGIYSLAAAKLVGSAGLVLAFEPSRATFETLKQNVLLNRMENIRVSQLALADCKGTGWLQHQPDPGRNALVSAVRAENIGLEQVEVATLDDIISMFQCGRPNCIKIDTEGAEELVLRGAVEVLRSKPAIIFEANPEAAIRLGLQPDGAYRYLQALGYRFYRLGLGGLERLEMFPGGGNIVALV